MKPEEEKKVKPEDFGRDLAPDVAKLKKAAAALGEEWIQLKKKALTPDPIQWQQGMPDGWDWFRFKGFRLIVSRLALYRNWQWIGRIGWWRGIVRKKTPPDIHTYFD